MERSIYSNNYLQVSWIRTKTIIHVSILVKLSGINETGEHPPNLYYHTTMYVTHLPRISSRI